MTVPFFKKAICLLLMPLLIISTAIPPASAAYNKLAPHDFYEMYALAANGKISKLSNAIHRGLDIDAVNQNGDTGLCVAAKQKNAKAYNTFRNLGANPAHPCTRNIPHYQSFVNSRAVQAGAFWQESSYAPPAYNMENSSSDKWKLAGLLLLLGGGAAILLSGGGGGGGGDDEPAENPGLSCEYGCAEEDENGNCLVCNDAPDPADPCEEDPCAEGCYTNITCGPSETCSQQNACGGCEACTATEEPPAEEWEKFALEAAGGNPYNLIGNEEDIYHEKPESEYNFDHRYIGGIKAYAYFSTNTGNITVVSFDNMTSEVIFGILKGDNISVSDDFLTRSKIFAGNYGLTNSGDITIEAPAHTGIGIYANGFGRNDGSVYVLSRLESLVNEGKITITGTNSSGIMLVGNGKLDNSGAINISGQMKKYRDSSSVQRETYSTQTVVDDNYIYQYVMPTLDNTGIFFANHDRGYGIESVMNNSVTNSGDITLNLDSDTIDLDTPFASVGEDEEFQTAAGISVDYSPLNEYDLLTVSNSGNIDINFTSSLLEESEADAEAIFAARKRYYIVGLNISSTEEGKDLLNVENTGTISLSGNGSMHGIAAKNAVIENKGNIFIDMNSQKYDAETRNFVSVGILAQDSVINQYANIDYQISGAGGSFYSAAMYNSTLNVGPDAKISGTVAAYNSTVNNLGTIEVSGQSADESTYGLWLTGDSGGYNEGVIHVDASQNGIGVYAEQTETDGFENKGSIIVNSTNGIGMYANGYEGGIHDRYVRLVNSGTISVTGDNSVGMYANGANSVIVNTGEIIVSGNNSQETDTANRGTFSDGSKTEAQAFRLVNGAALYNLGTLESDGNLDFDALTDNQSKVIAGKSSVIKAESVNGTLYAGADITTGSNEDYYESRVIEAEENNATVASNSAMFAAEMAGDKMVMTRYDFNEIVADKNLAAYLENNYQQGNRVDLYDTFKAAQDTEVLNSTISSMLGADFVPALAYQNLERVRYINRTMADLMQNNPSAKDERVSVISNNYYHDIKAHGGVSGYEEKLFGFNGLFDKKINNNFRYGIGLGLYRVNVDFDDGIDRNDNLFEVYNPYWFDYERWGALIMPYAGYSDGDYDRRENSKKYSADLKAWYYGLNNRIYLKNQAAGLEIRPTAELNLNGIYQDNFSEDDGLSVKGKNMFSAEAGLGAHVSKAADFGENGRLNLKFGGMYYYELNDDAYQGLNARFAGMNGMYYLDGYDNRRSRGIVSLKANYQFKGWNLYAEITRLLEHNDNMVYNAGLKYSF